ncbi:MAG TPA: thioredoxin family protein [Thermoplasmata archaeon]|nr:thioredoxin family protein [Thermoplasmata archaeon]
MMLTDSDRVSLQRRLSDSLKDEVKMLVFTLQGISASNDLVDLARTIASASPKIKVEVETVVDGKNQRLRDLRMENAPALVLVKEDFSRIRYYGIPAGYEIPPIIDALVELSNHSTPLSPNAKATLATIRRRANIKIFVLTTCTFCPIVARHAYRAAIESPKVTAEVIDSQLFQDLATRHSVMGVPKIILNDNTDITGAIQEADFFQKLKDSDIAQIDSMFG